MITLWGLTHNTTTTPTTTTPHIVTYTHCHQGLNHSTGWVADTTYHSSARFVKVEDNCFVFMVKEFIMRLMTDPHTLHLQHST